ncbi:MAG: polysaccharide biosynthesis tyrosine autokinase [Anaerolineae bacterium]|nr:MAG: polysaccharide biosynthesis tyrosine autokinase [Anaerolineae bacterium]
MEFDLRQYLRLVLKWWWLLVIAAIIPVVVSLHFTSQQTTLYQAQVVLMVGTTLQSTDPNASEIGIAGQLARSYAAMVRYRPVTNEVIRKLGLHTSPEQLAKQIVAFVRPEANLLEIWVTDSNPRAAALIANALADELIRQSPASSRLKGEQQRFIEQQLNDLKGKIEQVENDIAEQAAALVNLTSAAEIQAAQENLDALEAIASRYHSQYTQYLESYTGDSVNQLAIVEPAVEPTDPVPSKRKMISAVAGAAGLALALAAVFALEYLDNTVRWKGDQEQELMGMPVLGTVARMSNNKGAIIARSTERSPESEAIRNLRTNLFLSRRRAPYRSVLITSPGSQEGKSFVAANLAVSFAAGGLRTVLVDGDMRKPTQHMIFDLPNFYGLANVLDRAVSAEEVVSGMGLHRTDVPNLSIMSAGKTPLDPTILLTSHNLALLMQALQEHADVVVMDSPPVLAVPDTFLLAAECEATLLVARNGTSSRSEISKAKKELLQYEDVNLTGIAFNNVKLQSGYHYYYYSTANVRSLLDRLWARLSMLSSNGHTLDDPDRPLGLREMAAYLGIGPRIARRWCKEGRIPAFKSHLRWHARYGDLHAMVTRHLLGEAEGESTHRVGAGSQL